MSFNWNDLLHLAIKLASPENGCPCAEACHRSSISRAYYSVFSQVRTRMRRASGKTYSGSGCHSVLIDDVKSYGTANSTYLYAILKTMKDMRVYADYKPDLPDTDSQGLADTQIESAYKALIYLRDLNN